MAKSLLKTKIVELLKVDRKSIVFDIDIEEEVSIRISGVDLLKFEFIENPFCCGVLDCGTTEISNQFNLLTEDDRNSLLVDCFNQLFKMIRENTGGDEGEIAKGLLVWTHTNNNIGSIALRSQFNTEDMPWKFIQEFHNPNSGNTVNYFIANLN